MLEHARSIQKKLNADACTFCKWFHGHYCALYGMIPEGEFACPKYEEEGKTLDDYTEIGA